MSSYSIYEFDVDLYIFKNMTEKLLYLPVQYAGQLENIEGP